MISNKSSNENVQIKSSSSKNGDKNDKEIHDTTELEENDSKSEEESMTDKIINSTQLEENDDESSNDKNNKDTEKQISKSKNDEEDSTKDESSFTSFTISSTSEFKSYKISSEISPDLPSEKMKDKNLLQKNNQKKYLKVKVQQLKKRHIHLKNWALEVCFILSGSNDKKINIFLLINFILLNVYLFIL